MQKIAAVQMHFFAQKALEWGNHQTNMILAHLHTEQLQLLETAII